MKNTIDRFWDKVDKSGTCWQWTGAKSRYGGGFSAPNPKGGKEWVGIRSHRFSYELANGPIPIGMMVLHSCKNYYCVNPEHLYLSKKIEYPKEPRKRRPIKDRFFEKVNKTDTCWLWIAMLNKNGYGMFGNGKGKMQLAHRFSYELVNGPIPNKLFACHTCDNRQCVNPDHIFLGTASDNLQDMAAKGRGFHQQKQLCPYGHDYTPIYKEGRLIRRTCIVCKNLNSKRYYHAKKENTV